MTSTDSDSLFNVRDKIVLVTGGAKGIGAMISRAFHAAKVKTLIITGRDKKALTKLAQELGASNSTVRVIAIPADLAKSEDITALVQKIKTETSEQLDILINNAGANWGVDYEKYEDEHFERVLNLNVKKVFMLTRLLTPLLENSASKNASLSRVINIGSIDGIRIPALPTFAYSASKAALHHMTRVLAAHLANRRILVNAIAPGPFESKMMAATLDRFRTEIEASIPLGRIGNPEDVGALCIFLSGRGSSYITGAVIPLDGGILCKSSL